MNAASHQKKKVLKEVVLVYINRLPDFMYVQGIGLCSFLCEKFWREEGSKAGMARFDCGHRRRKVVLF